NNRRSAHVRGAGKTAQPDDRLCRANHADKLRLLTPSSPVPDLPLQPSATLGGSMPDRLVSSQPDPS
ncbi:MAG: hypothetical protein ACPIOQ_09575, partial [Promethearchaeia archaeon]